MSPHVDELIVAEDGPQLAAHAAAYIAEQIKRAPGIFRLALSGGSTPRALYTLLGMAKDVAWERVELFWGDERFVPPESADSNFRLVRETLLAGGAKPKAVYPMPTDGTPADAALRYQALLQRAYGSAVLTPERALFDLNLLGLGEDGHTASLLPGEPVLQMRAAWVAAVPHGREQPRLTLTFPALESSKVTLFLVTGAGKAEALARARAHDTSIPAGALRPQGSTIWFADRAAAGA